MRTLSASRCAVATLSIFRVLVTGLTAQAPATREMEAEHRWLNFPISDTAPLRQVEILRDNKSERVFMAQLAPDHPGGWTSVDIGVWKGSKVGIRIADTTPDSTFLSCIDATDEAREISPGLYYESLRPKYHFSARRGWLNDPNGLVFCNGQYHLFFQHNPFSWVSASKHWGHAISSDLVHWNEVGEALYPDANGQMYSGSAVVDRENSSGLDPDAKTPLVLVYTNAGRGSTQCLASTRDGLVFDKYSGNPVIPRMSGPSRDPKVFWYEPAQQWIMALYVGTGDPLQPDKPGEFHDRHSIHLYVSRDLRTWQETDIIEGGVGGRDRFLFECPDIFPLPLDGHSDQVKWIVQGGSGEYRVGSFDGKKFAAEGPRLQSRFGGDFYAAQTFNNVPGARIIQIGWMRAPTPGMLFNQCLSIPLDLALKNTAEGVRLAYAPVDELKKLRGTPVVVPAGPLVPQQNALDGVTGDSLDMEAEIRPGTAPQIMFDFRGVKLLYEVAAKTLHCKNTTARVPLDQGVLRLRMLLDRTTLDIFTADGFVYFPVAILPADSNQTYRLAVPTGTAEIVSLKVYPMQSAWLP